jgi:predicted DCC family thiol-disulfide oxidoreductase YuxK
MAANFPLTLFYDAGCAVCALEMDHLRARCTEGSLNFIDISAAGFDPARHGLTMAALDAEIHGVQPDGTVIRGVPVLRLAYEVAGMGWVLRPTGWPVLRPVFDLGYRLFARHRRAISGVASPLIRAIRTRRARRALARMQGCSSGTCAARTRTVEGDRS